MDDKRSDRMVVTVKAVTPAKETDEIHQAEIQKLKKMLKKQTVWRKMRRRKITRWLFLLRKLQIVNTIKLLLVRKMK